MQLQRAEHNDLLASQIKCALLREALNHGVVTQQQFSKLMELQRGR